MVEETGDTDRALGIFRKAVESGLPDDLLFRTLWDIATAGAQTGQSLSGANDLGRVGRVEKSLSRESPSRNWRSTPSTPRKTMREPLEFTRNALSLEPSVELESGTAAEEEGHAKA